MSNSINKRLKIDEYFKGIRENNRIILAQAISLMESSLPSDYEISASLVTEILPYTGKSVRIGVSGVPGAGKSTLIEALGLQLISLGKKVAVIAIDPSSSVTKGSILGDKTRMEKLSASGMAFIRPVPSSGAPGGISWRTKEIILLCEAAGYDVVLVETVGVGQSEHRIFDLVDYFLFIMLAGAGDELQSIKKGTLELADGILINKADGDNFHSSIAYKDELEKSIRLFLPYKKRVPVLIGSALESKGMAELWKQLEDEIKFRKKSDEFAERRNQQEVAWMHLCLEERIKQFFEENIPLRQIVQKEEENVKEGRKSAYMAAMEVFNNFISSAKTN
ncbi:MAG: methylmalonyl Co-A mutase-associated GTPase MeaB [Cytophagaceae bacterium]